MSNRSNRREFLHAAAGASLAATGIASTCSATETPHDPKRKKLILVVFGGGTRSSESIDDPRHRYIPNLWNKLVPKGTLFTNMRVEHRVVHPNSTGSIMTGHWEWDDLDWSKPVAHPTIFEIFRKAHDAPDTAAWSFVYASILANTARSTAAGYGDRFAANVVMPPTIPRTASEEMDRLMAAAAVTGSVERQHQAARECARIARTRSRINTDGLRSDVARKWMTEQYQSWRSGTDTTSHDAFLTDRAIACMKRFSPDVISIAFGEIDCAHYGSWSRYVEAIQRTDALTNRLWRATQELPAYRGNTRMLILPDHGRELDHPNRSGFIHHSDFYTNTNADEGCRRVWMLMVGPGVETGKTIDRPVPLTAAAATGLSHLGLRASHGAARSVLNALE